MFDRNRGRHRPRRRRAPLYPMLLVVVGVLAGASLPAMARDGDGLTNDVVTTTSADDPDSSSTGASEGTETTEGEDGLAAAGDDPAEAVAGEADQSTEADAGSRPTGSSDATNTSDEAASDEEGAGGGDAEASRTAEAAAVEPGSPTTTLGVQPQVVSGNPDCADVLGTDGFLFEEKLEPVEDATIALSHEGMTGTLVVDVTGSTFDFTFSGDFVAAAVIVKGGPNANFYDYGPDGAAADTGLHAPVNPANGTFYGLSHISFCVAAAGEGEQPNPDIRLVKTAAPTLVHVGDTVTYTFEVTNTGEEDLFDVTLTDDTGICDADPVLVDDADGDTTLAVDETWTFTCDHVTTEDDPSRLENTASVTAVNESGEEVSDEDDAVVRIIHPAIDLDKSVSATTVPVGTTVTYTFVVTNTGDTTLFDVVVTDDVLGTIGTIDELAAGASMTFTAEFQVGTAPVTNVATAVGTDVLGRSVSDQDAVTVTPIAGGGGPGPGPGEGPDGGGIVGGGGGTPFTGADAGLLGLLAAGLIGAGAAVVSATRRRRTEV
jgi:hypothetical protein